MEGNLRFKIDWASLIVGRKFTVFPLFYFVLEGNFQVQVPGGLYLEVLGLGSIMAGRAGIVSCFYALILFLPLTQFAKSQPTLQENRKFLILKDFSWSRRFLIPIYADFCNLWKTKKNRSAILVRCCM